MFSVQDQTIGVPVRVSDKAWVAVSGEVGADPAVVVANRLLDAGADALVSWGSAGALDPKLNAGDLLLPDRIIHPDGEEYWPDSQWFQRTRDALRGEFAVRKGTLLQNPILVSTTRDKQELYKALQAVAVDMESAALAQIAQQRNVPFLTVRAIADTASQGMPKVIRHAIEVQGHIKYARLFRDLCLRPGDLPALFTLGRHFLSARKTLLGLSSYAISGFFLESDATGGVSASMPMLDRGSRTS